MVKAELELSNKSCKCEQPILASVSVTHLLLHTTARQACKRAALIKRASCSDARVRVSYPSTLTAGTSACMRVLPCMRVLSGQC
eukprot:6173209-Pleurochrysis_carterae.AAC.1